MRNTLTILAATIALAALGTGASAHSKSSTFTPEDGATVTDVPEITMQFDDPMRVISVGLTRDGEDAALERETGTDPVTEFVARPAGDLAPGAYTVEWRGMSADGHPMQGSFSFTLAQ
ncbi:copper resistance CopC family protein [Palleronia pelagia]|uniref:CopC domain-containing protein n=1 Tax=Palleronia pelagia TaxID=387096 RepID=A0A1H8FJI6_9RHOB|nr:copper resistance CopC family protein [Palleronia pelagia]SEN31806.1 hypothetical protein SAMN04488011_103360 [Palleronia pelagia]